MTYLWRVCLVVAMGGLLFGYDFVVIGGAKPFYEPFFDITDATPWRRGFAQSAALLGCILGALMSGSLSDYLGRKRLLILAGFFFTASAVWTALSGSLPFFNVARFLGGAAIGLASSLSPMYIAEISPAQMRGRFVAINQLTIVMGILIAQLVNYGIAQPVVPDATAELIRESWNGIHGWRWMFGAEAAPAMIFFFLMLVVPESPRWLIKRGREKEAQRILASVGGEEYAQFEVDDIKKTIASEEVASVRFRDLIEPRLLPILGLGIFLAVFQQWCGINVIFNYAQEVFAAAGYNVGDLMFSIVVTGVVNMVFTFVAILTVDKIGRRPLMLYGSAGLACIYMLLGTGYFLHSTGLHMLILVVAAIACFAMTLGPIVWVVVSEIFPNRIRGAAMSIAVLSLWIGCTSLTFTFPVLNKALNTHGVFWLYGAICVVGYAVVFRYLPETKGKSLEDIERELVD